MNLRHHWLPSPMGLGVTYWRWENHPNTLVVRIGGHHYELQGEKKWQDRHGLAEVYRLAGITLVAVGLGRTAGRIHANVLRRRAG